MSFRKTLAKGSITELLEVQNNQCAICGESESESEQLHVDHDHASGLVRGMLCRGCNLGLGNFKDDPIRLAVAIAYLQNRPTKALLEMYRDMRRACRKEHADTALVKIRNMIRQKEKGSVVINREIFDALPQVHRTSIYRSIKVLVRSGVLKHLAQGSHLVI